MVGLVAVSHSNALAEAALGLALEMVAGDPPRVILAAGLDDGGFGTDAVRVAEAIAEADDGDGVVVITDLGSAILSAEMALEFLPDPDTVARIVPAPFVEGLLAAVVAAAGGASLEEVAALASSALQPKREQLGYDDGASGGASLAPPAGAGEGEAPVPGDEATGTATLINPLGLHARPAAALAGALAGLGAKVTLAVPGRASVPANSPLSVAGLGTRGGDEVTVSATGPQAAHAVELLTGLIAGGFGEAVAEGPADAAAAPASALGSPALPAPGEGPDAPGEGPRPASGAGEPGAPLAAESGPSSPGARGLGVSPVRVVGPVALMPDPLAAPVTGAPLPPAEREREASRLAQASAAVVRVLTDRAARATGEPAAVLTATAALAADPAPLDAATERIRAGGESAEAAVWDEYAAIAARFEAAGGTLAQRAVDVRDVRGRLVAQLRGVEAPGLPEREAPFVLVAGDLAPADTAGIDPARVLAIVSAEGGPTSHTAILARSLGLPAVVGWAGATSLDEGQTVLVDGGTGEVIPDPSPDEASGARSAPAAAASVAFTGTASLRDGTALQLLANVGGPADATAAAGLGAPGVGLFRTEFAFLERTDAPGEDEQAALYAAVLRAFPGGKVVLRTLDSGSDKPLAFLPSGPEENPALGVRGLRTSWNHPGLLATQLAAIARAQAAVPGTEAWVMAPMVATVEEAASFAEQARAAGLRRVGIMVETPAAALCAAELAEHVDFFSLGTNDLTQYTLAADRLSPQLARLNDPWQPAVLRLIAATVDGAGAKPVGVCGEAAADPLLAAVLVGLGVSSLSMTPRSLGRVADALSRSSLDECINASAGALRASGPDEARRAAAAALGVDDPPSGR